MKKWIPQQVKYKRDRRKKAATAILVRGWISSDQMKAPGAPGQGHDLASVDATASTAAATPAGSQFLHHRDREER
jgi:hypothetical protein